MYLPSEENQNACTRETASTLTQSPASDIKKQSHHPRNTARGLAAPEEQMVKLTTPTSCALQGLTRSFPEKILLQRDSPSQNLPGCPPQSAVPLHCTLASSYMDVRYSSRNRRVRTAKVMLLLRELFNTRNSLYCFWAHPTY